MKRFDPIPKEAGDVKTEWSVFFYYIVDMVIANTVHSGSGEQLTSTKDAERNTFRISSIPPTRLPLRKQRWGMQGPTRPSSKLMYLKSRDGAVLADMPLQYRVEVRDIVSELGN